MRSETLKTVLYVEDNAVNICLMEAMFAERAEIRFVTALNGRAGLEAAEQQRPDLILLDLNLPDMDGEEFLAKLSADPALATIPVIVVSADAPEEQRARILSLKAAAYVTKPFDINQFERIIDRHLKADC